MCSVTSKVEVVNIFPITISHHLKPPSNKVDIATVSFLALTLLNDPVELCIYLFNYKSPIGLSLTILSQLIN